MLHLELDKWMYDIESGKYTMRKGNRRIYLKLEKFRNYYYKKHCNQIKSKNFGEVLKERPTPLTCKERFTPPRKPQSIIDRETII